MEIYSFSPFGYEGALVRVEVDLCRGIPAMDLVGLPDGTVRESRERIRAAIRNSALEFPAERVLINLSPGDVRKEGSGFDLPIALAILAAAGKVPEGGDSRVLVMGELELSGHVRKVRGISAAIYSGVEQGIGTFIIPREGIPRDSVRQDGFLRGDAIPRDGMESLDVPSRDRGRPVRVIGVETLQEAFSCLLRISGGELFEEEGLGDYACEGGLPGSEVFSIGGGERGGGEPVFEEVCRERDYIDVKGQSRLIRALQIAAAGGHHLFAFGPPGCGKTLALERFGTLLPLLTEQDSHTVTRIHSLSV